MCYTYMGNEWVSYNEVCISRSVVSMLYITVDHFIKGGPF